MRPQSGPPYDSVRCSTQNARLCLECQTLTGLRGQYNAHVFLCKRRAAKIFKSFSMHRLVLLEIRKHDKVCDEVPLEQCVPNDRQSWTNALSANAAENCERN